MDATDELSSSSPSPCIPTAVLLLVKVGRGSNSPLEQSQLFLFFFFFFYFFLHILYTDGQAHYFILFPCGAFRRIKPKELELLKVLSPQVPLSPRLRWKQSSLGNEISFLPPKTCPNLLLLPLLEDTNFDGVNFRTQSIFIMAPAFASNQAGSLYSRNLLPLKPRGTSFSALN